jgi:ABC-type glycerol-3-phosphate transport system substrate-binding protein
MKKSTSPFQIVILVVMILGTVVGVLAFSGYLKLGKSSSSTASVTGSVSIWGTLPRSAMAEFINEQSTKNRDLKLSYTEVPEENFNQTVIEAIAAGKGPDVVIIDDSMLLQYQNKAFVIPYTSYTEGQMKTNFIREAELLLTPNGILGFPVLVDPLVLYYNRDLFDKAGIALPPKTWEEIKDRTPELAVVDKGNFTIKQSAIALGEYDNIPQAKQILLALFLQAGNTLTTMNQGMYMPTFVQDDPKKASLVSPLTFFTSFASPTAPLYSWNKGLPNATQQFLLGKSAMYIGFASELFELQKKNPNFNFDVVAFPQNAKATSAVTYGKLYSAVILKSSKNIPASYVTAGLLSGNEAQQFLSSRLSLPPVRRELLAVRPSQSYAQVFYNGALTARSWLDPDAQKSTPFFKQLISAINSGRLSVDFALAELQASLFPLYPQPEELTTDMPTTGQ